MKEDLLRQIKSQKPIENAFVSALERSEQTITSYQSKSNRSVSTYGKLENQHSKQQMPSTRQPQLLQQANFQHQVTQNPLQYSQKPNQQKLDQTRV